MSAELSQRCGFLIFLDLYFKLAVCLHRVVPVCVCLCVLRVLKMVSSGLDWSQWIPSL